MRRNMVLILVKLGLIVIGSIGILTAVGLKILSDSIFRYLFEISMILVGALMNFTLVRIEWQMDWFLVIYIASGWFKHIFVSVSRN